MKEPTRRLFSVLLNGTGFQDASMRKRKVGQTRSHNECLSRFAGSVVID